MNFERLKKQINFILEIDKLKKISRRTLLTDESRTENDAEHSWHLAVMALLLSEYCDEEIDVSRVVKMVLIHDIVEIDAGDTFCYDYKAGEDKEEREQKAADRLFGLLPDDQSVEFRQLWEEFEERITPESRFAAALDRLQPLLHNYMTQGGTWRMYDITMDMVMKRAQPIEEISADLWDYTKKILEQSVEKGYLSQKKR